MWLCEFAESCEDCADRLWAFAAVEEEDSFAAFDLLRFASLDDAGGAGVAGLDFAEEGHGAGVRETV